MPTNSRLKTHCSRLTLLETYDSRLGIGLLSVQGRATSSWAANLNRVASSPNRPTKCDPIGSPSLFQNKGTDIAGWPVILQIGVNGAKAPARLIPRMGSSGGESKLPSGRGGSARVGVSHTSYRSKKRAISRDEDCNT